MRLQIKKRGQYKGIFFTLAIIFLLVSSSAVFFLERAEPIFRERAADASTQEIRRLIDAISMEVISEYSLFDEKRLDGGNLSVIELNTSEFNKLRTQFSEKLTESLANTYYTKIYISLGSLLNSAVLQGMGFRIPVRIFFGAISHIDIKDEFTSAGINQTKYRATLEITVSSSVVFAFMADSRDINVSLPICERIIIGEVPNYYLPSKG